MEARLHKAAREGNMELLTRILEENNRPYLTLSLTPQKNTALHIAVAFGHEQIVQEMIDREPSLISQPNSNGDTPLHIAAKAGNLSLTKLLTPPLEEGVRWREAGAAALKMKNSDGYTPIHESLKKRHEHLVYHLLGFDGDIEAADDVSDAGESLLYLASDAGLYRSVDMILRSGNFSTRGPNGQNPLHIAVIRGNSEIVGELLYVPHLIKEADDFGKTALHYASTIGYYVGDIKREWILYRLIRTEPSLAYKSDNDGNVPLLIATIEAPFAAVEIILRHCPDSAELVDRRGRNALHLAVLNNRVSTLGSLINRPEFKMLINQPDNGKNTPMHLATKHNYLKIVELLLTCEGLDLAATNKEGLTAMDICGYTTKQRLIHDKLKGRGARPSCQRKMLLTPPPPKTSLAPELVNNSSDTKAITETLSIVTTLVATVTFAAAFAVPGGYKNDGVQEGMPVFIKNAALKTFLFSDTLAFCSSMAATILLVYASVNPTDKHLSASALNTCAYIAAVAIPATITAFMTGIYVLTSKEIFWFAVTSFILGCVVSLFVFLRVVHMKRRAEKKNQQPMESESSREAHEDVLENHRGDREDVPMGPSSPAPPNVDVPVCENLV